MPRWLETCRAAALAILLAGPWAHAQVKEEPPSPKIDANWSYVSPGPVKCVEVGNLYLHKGNLKGALSRFQEAVQTGPHYAPGYLGLGKVYERMGLKQKALENYERYLDELPSSKQAAEAKDAHQAVARLQKELGPNYHPPNPIPPQ
jgi:tetratricopeptide (TPR) repeat protein